MEDDGYVSLKFDISRENESDSEDTDDRQPSAKGWEPTLMMIKILHLGYLEVVVKNFDCIYYLLYVLIYIK